MQAVDAAVRAGLANARPSDDGSANLGAYVQLGHVLGGTAAVPEETMTYLEDVYENVK